jgi:hypothetical protein
MCWQQKIWLCWLHVRWFFCRPYIKHNIPLRWGDLPEKHSYLPEGDNGHGWDPERGSVLRLCFPCVWLHCYIFWSHVVQWIHLQPQPNDDKILF